MLTKTSATEAIWRDFVRHAGLGHADYQVVAFGDTPGMATELAALVVGGTKRATASLTRDYANGRLPLPAVGDFVVVVDGAGASRCIWRTTEIAIKPLDAVDARFAWDEGEGDRSLAWWALRIAATSPARRSETASSCMTRFSPYSSDSPWCGRSASRIADRTDRGDPGLPTFRRPTRYGPAVPSSEGRIRMSKSIMEIVAAARQAVPAISPADAAAMMGRDDVLVVDVRDLPEVAEGGKVKGAIQVSRGMLEFRADETTPYHIPALPEAKTIILYCASGGRSALAGKALQELGYTKVFNLGAFKDWVATGGAVER